MDCHQMKKGQIFHCAECGLELLVNRECDDCCGSDEETCTCNFSCCGEPLTLKQES